jgi:two-component system phosphate regulon response regulator PhoB
MVDDDELVLLSVAELLRAEGYEVATASDARAGLDRAAETRFDAVILDVVMPGLSGFDACARLRARPEYRDVPILLLTAKSSEADRVRGTEVGATRFLSKPIHPAKLIRAVAETLGERPAGGG